MKKQLFVPFFLFNILIWGQEIPQFNIKKTTDELNKMIQMKNDSLKIQLTLIDNKLKNAEITEEEAQNLRKETNESYVYELEDVLYEKIDSIWINKQEMDAAIFGVSIDEMEMEEEIEVETDSIDAPPIEDDFQNKLKKRKEPKYKSSVMYAFGVNNLMWNNEWSSIENSPYTLRGSTFMELAFFKNIPLSKSSQWIHFKYGLGFKYAELKLFNNLYHKDLGDLTVITTHSEELKKSKLTTSQILIPMEFILDFSKKSEDLKAKKGFKIGVGGYVGVNYYTTEMIKFKNSELRKQINYGNFNTNPFVYGLSGTIGFGKVALYTTYDLNTFYKNGNSNNISAGIRFDLKK